MLANRGGAVLLCGGQRVVGGVGQIPGGAVALPGVLGHTAGDDLIQSRRNLSRPQLAGPRSRFHQMGGDQSLDGFPAIRRCPGQALIQHARQRIDVRAVGDFVAAESLGRHVVISADRAAGLGEPLVFGGPRQSEVHQIGEVVGRDENVLRLDVAVGHADLVGRVQGGSDLADDSHRPRRAQRARPLQKPCQVSAFDQAHLDEELPVDLPVVVDGDDMRFGQSAGGVGFPLQPRAKSRVVGQLRGDQLDGDDAPLAGVLGPVDLAHPASAQQLDQLVGAEPGSGPR